MKCSSLLFIFTVLVFTPNSFADTLDRADLPSLIAALEIDKSLEFCGERVPIEIEEVKERLEKEIMLALWNRPQVLLWLKRSRRYLPLIEKALSEGGLPDDLKYVAIAESALRPHIGSKKGAMGFWQFMVGTGRKYGLVINSNIDERRNIYASTRAAVLCFKDLYENFGSWTLAAAAFNMGENGVSAEIMEQETKSYYRLYLPIETERYIFRILVVKMIFSDPKRYGFRLAEKDYYPRISFDEVELDNPREIPIRIVARASGTDFKEIKILNPEIRGHYTPEGRCLIRIPKGAGHGFHGRYQNLVKEFLAAREKRIYIVKEGDNLSIIAHRFDVPLAALMIWNHIDLRHPIHPGDRLVIYPNKRKGSYLNY